MGELVELKKYAADKEMQHLHEISKSMNIIDDEGNILTTIYHPLSPMAFKQRHDQFMDMINPKHRGVLVAYEPEPTIWQKFKNYLRGDHE